MAPAVVLVVVVVAARSLGTAVVGLDVVGGLGVATPAADGHGHWGQRVPNSRTGHDAQLPVAPQ